MKTIRTVLICSIALTISSAWAESSLHKVARGLNVWLQNLIPEQENMHLKKIETRRRKLAKDTTPLGKLTVAHSAKKASVPSSGGKLLFALTRAWKPQTVLELGTCIGISGAYISSALECNNQGELLSFERCEALFPFIEKNWQVMGIAKAKCIPGNVEQSLKEILPNTHNITMVFDDENHREEPTLEKFAIITPYLSTPALYVFDDISYNEGMRNAWKKIQRSSLVSVSIAIDTRIGICIIDPSIQEKQNITINHKRTKSIEVKDNRLVVHK